MGSLPSVYRGSGFCVRCAACPRVHVLCGIGNNKFFGLAKTAE
jgi:hypothetical protein